MTNKKNNQICIIISGSQKVGKTCVMSLLKHFFEKFGCKVKCINEEALKQVTEGCFDEEFAKHRLPEIIINLGEVTHIPSKIEE